MDYIISIAFPSDKVYKTILISTNYLQKLISVQKE